MKKILTMILAASMLMLCACSETPQSQETEATTIASLPTEAQDHGLCAGFARADITPEAPVPLAGYGSAEKRISRAVLDPLYVQVLALTDAEDNTVLLINWDATRSYTQVQELARQSITQATGVPMDKIYLGATHTHSAPEMHNQRVDSAAAYSVYVVEQTTAAAVAALEDRKPATMSAGSIEVEGLNFVRHYTYQDEAGNAQYFGDNFGDWVFNDTTTQVGEADKTMYLLRFEREAGPDIAFVNWRAHPHLTGGPSLYNISADWVGAFRNAVEYQTGTQVIYFNGASGNINEKSRISAENLTTDHAEYGALLANYAIELMESCLEPMDVTTITTRQTIYNAKVNHADDSKFYQAKEIMAQHAVTGVFDAEQAGAIGIRSRYHADSIISNYNRGESMNIELNALLLGDQIALVTAPNELVDTNSVWLEENAPTAFTLTLGYTNGHYGYVPSQLAWDYTCYESDISYFVPGTAEAYQQIFLDMIHKLKGGA